MRHFISTLISFLFISCSLVNAQNEPLVGGFYINGSGLIGVYVGPKEIARIEVTLTAKDEYGKECKFSTTKSLIGPMFSYRHYNFDLPYGSLGRYPIGFISKIKIIFNDKTIKNCNRKESARLNGEYYERRGRGF